MRIENYIDIQICFSITSTKLAIKLLKRYVRIDIIVKKFGRFFVEMRA